MVEQRSPKPRAEGSSPSAPANPLVPRPCENRMAWGFFVPMPGWTRSTKSRFMLHPLLSSRIRPQPVSTAVFPSSTQNAPGFALFGLFRVRLALFRCFGAAKFSANSLCILPHSVYKLKLLVIPCRREDPPRCVQPAYCNSPCLCYTKKVRQAHNKNSEF